VEPKLPKHDTIETVPAGEGWQAHVAFRKDKVVGIVISPEDGRHIADLLDLRDVSLSEARGKAHARESGLDLDGATREVLARRRKKPPSGRERETDRNLLVAILVLRAAELGKDRYGFLRSELTRAGYELGKDPKGQTETVKRWIENATKNRYLEKRGSGRGPRRPGARLKLAAIHLEVPMTVKLRAKRIPVKKGKEMP
jgi:hypothetical protein